MKRSRGTRRTQRLAAERDKASASLREWGSVEGPDLEVPRRFTCP